MASPALDLLLRYVDDPKLDPMMEDVRPGVSGGVLDTIRRGRLLGGRSAPTRAGRMNELDKFLTFRERIEKQQQMRSSGMLKQGSHEDLNFFNDLHTMEPRYIDDPGDRTNRKDFRPPQMNGFMPPRFSSPLRLPGSSTDRRMP